MTDFQSVNHPAHYGGDTEYEVIKVLEAWDLKLALGFCWGNNIKYQARAGQKGSALEDRKKAAWYASRAVEIEEKIAAQEQSPVVEAALPLADKYPVFQPPGKVVEDYLGQVWVQDPTGRVWVKPVGRETGYHRLVSRTSTPASVQEKFDAQ